MRSAQILIRNKVARVNKTRHAGRILFAEPEMTLFPERTEHNLIQWPTEQQIQEVSRRLARINEKGIRWEARGDYFNSGDLAYQLQEIIRATAELFKKSQRIKR